MQSEQDSGLVSGMHMPVMKILLGIWPIEELKKPLWDVTLEAIEDRIWRRFEWYALLGLK